MKAVLVILLVFSNICFSLGQTKINANEIPVSVVRFFPAVYKLPNSVNVEWTIEDDSIYVARFVSNNYPVIVKFKENGFWINTFWEIDNIYLPKIIKENIERDFKGFIIDKCYLSNNSFNETLYHVYLFSKKKKRADTTVVYYPDGKQK